MQWASSWFSILYALFHKYARLKSREYCKDLQSMTALRQAYKQKVSERFDILYLGSLQVLDKSVGCYICVFCCCPSQEARISYIEDIKNRWHYDKQKLKFATLLIAAKQYKYRVPEASRILQRIFLNNEDCFGYELDILQRINCEEKKIKIYEEFANKQNGVFLSSALVNVATLYQSEDRIYPEMNYYPKIVSAYKRAYTVSQSVHTISAWMDYELQQRQPNRQSVINFVRQEGPRDIIKLIMLIYDRKYQSAWEYLLSQRASNFFARYTDIFTLIDLHQFKELEKKLKSNCSSFQAYALNRYADQLSEQFRLQSGEDKVKNHAKWIQFYETNNFLSSLVYTYRKIISLLTIGHPYPGSSLETQEKKNQRILLYYEKLLFAMSQDQVNNKTADKGKVFASMIRNIFSHNQPTYKHLLIIREKYFSNALGDALIYLCAKDYNRARIVAESCDIIQKDSSSAIQILNIINFLEKKRYGETRKLLQAFKAGEDYWIEVLKTRIVEMGIEQEKQHL